MTNNNKKVHFFELDRGNGGHAQIGQYRDVTVEANAHSDIINDSISADRLPEGIGVNSERRPVGTNGMEDWAIYAEGSPGEHTYVFRLAKEGFGDGAYFSPDADPVISLSGFCPPMQPFIYDIKSYCVCGEEKPRWASFAFDCGSIVHHRIEGLGSKLVGNEAYQGGVIELPLHLSVIDAMSGLPAWMLADHHHPHEHDPIKPMHPGFHPPHFTTPLVVDLPR